jgi:ectoine hydroxylase-related dioxygenase (phytanoyl-CoA dioxygenase family)
LIDSSHLDQWERDGFFLLRRFSPPQVGRAMEQEILARLHADPPSAHPGEPAYVMAQGLLVQPEAKVPEGAVHPEDFVAKLFNPHLAGTAHDFALSEPAADVVSAILGPDIDVFQSMLILKNPGAWGQPWHQDSLYFDFDQQPQVGLWLAISEATLDNGCLMVLPGSHKGPIRPHHPDRRPGANHGYLEIADVDEAASIPVLMQPGDLLVFHSYLLHKSVDNRGTGRRSAMVYHYGRAGTINLAPADKRSLQERVTRWLPVRRRAVARNAPARPVPATE